MEAEFRHRFRVKEIASVENNWRSHPILNQGEIDVSKLCPFGSHDKGFHSFHGLERRLSEPGLRDQFYFPCLVCSFWVVDRDMSAFLQDVGDQIDRN